MNLAWLDIRHHWGRFVLSCLGLSLLMAVVLSMIGIYRGLVADALMLVRAPEADIWVVEAGTRGPFAEASRIPHDTREMIARLNGVAEAASLTYQTTEAEHNGRILRLFVVGYEQGQMGGPRDLLAGRTLTRKHFDLVADVKTGLALGDAVKLGRDIFRVVGLTRRQVSSGGDPVVYMSLADSQSLQFDSYPAAIRRERARGAAGGQTPLVNTVIARVRDGHCVTEVVEAIQRWKHMVAMTGTDQERILTQSVIDKVKKQIGLFTTILLVVSAVIIALIIYTMTTDKVREIATLKLIGAPNRTIMMMIVQQAVAMGGIAFALGAILVVNVKDSFPRHVLLQPQDGLLLAVAVVMICVASSGLGVRLAMKVDPATALGG